MVQLRQILVCLFLVTGSRMVMAQPDQSAMLGEKFTQFQLHHFQEKLYVHVAKTFYLAGETIWFRIFEVDGYYHKPLALSRVAYVEVLGSDQRPVIQGKVEMKESRGSGSFSIPVTLPSGNYKLRAYTSWMKNFDPDYYFEQPITVINTLKETSSAQVSAPDSISIQFFPEGGNLVAGLESVIGFKAISRTGDGVNCQGVIVNQHKDTVARFGSLRFGMGHFSFKPLEDDQYSAIVRAGDSVFRAALPEVHSEGYVMRLSEESGGKIKIATVTNVSGSALPVYLLVHTRQVVKLVDQATLSAGREANFFIDRSLLGDGITTFTLFNSKKQPICERLFCKRPEKQWSIQAKPLESAVTTRGKIDLELRTLDYAGAAVSPDLSMSVFMLDSLQGVPEEDIRSYLLLQSDLKGRIQDPAYYFDQSDAEANEALDNLMLTQGWRRFRWDKVYGDQKTYFEFLPETEGMVINGKITGKIGNQPGKNIMAYLSVPGKKFNFTNSVSDSGGRIRFLPDMFYGNSEIITALNNRADSNYSVDILSSYSDHFSATRLPDFKYPARWQNQLLERSISMQVENTYRLDKKHRILPVPAMDTTPFYGYPDREYYLDEYTRFKTMEEVMREYIADVRVRKEADRFYFRVNNSPMKEFFDADPLVLLDGVPVFDLNRIMDFNPLKIQKIGVVSGLFYQGALANTGIVSYQTYDGDLAGFELDPGSVVVEFDGIQRQREFYSPVYDTEDRIHSPVPDFRNLLFWAPEIRTGPDGIKKVTFYGSDLPGKFAILVQGLTPDGIPGSRWLTIDIKKP